ncbi:MAG: lipocalin family protein [Alistipes sp.]|nr:lipocalin family protein [Alistipes senegalensis]MCM1249874.1 lipocalin family protein [Alistipes sp.]
MKKIFEFALLSLALVLCGACDDENKVPSRLEVNANNVAGTWQLAEWNGAPLPAGTYVYLTLVRKECLFEMVQNVDSFLKRSLTGRFNITDDEETGAVIRGLYDHGTGDWKHAYRITELSADRMVWIAQDDPTDISVYVRIEGIPEDLK